MLSSSPAFPPTDGIPDEIRQQYDDNLRWLGEAEKHKMVVGSQARSVVLCSIDPKVQI